MLFAKATAEGIRVTGFLEQPALVLVTCKSRDGERRVLPVNCSEYGFFTQDVALKGFEPVGVPIILKTHRTLYVNRPVKNADEIIAWFKAQGMQTLLPPEEMHVTIAYSKRRVDWEALGDENTDEIEMEPSLRRSVIPLGDKGAIVLQVASPELNTRWKTFIHKGASWDWDGYRPHITLTYKSDVDAGRFIPFPGRIILGPEKFAEVDTDWSPAEKADRKSPPKGYPQDRSQYAVPEDYEFPIDEKHIHAAIGYFHTHRFKDEAQKKRAAKRILSAAKKYGVEVKDDDDVARAAHGG